MNQFYAYFCLGFEHISDIRGYDHMLFIVILCSIYKISDWKKVAILVTAFTIGHSTTLALSALKIIVTNVDLIEVLIPVTILCTSIANMFYNPTLHKRTASYSYMLTLVFGLIHGMGFSNFFNSLMGDSMGIIFPLFAFNVGLEIGQLIIVVFFFIFYFLFNSIRVIKQKNWILFFSGAGVGISLVMIMERLKLL